MPADMDGGPGADEGDERSRLHHHQLVLVTLTGDDGAELGKLPGATRQRKLHGLCQDGPQRGRGEVIELAQVAIAIGGGEEPLVVPARGRAACQGVGYAHCIVC
jgi:hypothetical protein